MPATNSAMSPRESRRVFEPPAFKMAILNGLSVYISRDIQTNVHSHHLLELVLSFGESFCISDTKSEICSTGIMISPDVPHQFTSNLKDYHIFIFLDPETQQAALLQRVFGLNKNPIQAISEEGIQTAIEGFKQWFYSNDFTPEAILPLIDQLVSALAPYHPFHPLIDARILHATRYIKQNLDSELDVKTVASEACLSESRFSHLFKEQIGIPLRRYILWCRMENAIRLIANGTNLSQAAYECGFSDPAHLTRTFQEMFGVKPSQALKQ